jgi:hypothetical protein
MKSLKRIKALKEIEEEKLKAEFESLLIKQRLVLRWLIVKSELAPERLFGSLLSSVISGLRHVSREKKKPETKIEKQE